MKGVYQESKTYSVCNEVKRAENLANGLCETRSFDGRGKTAELLPFTLPMTRLESKLFLRRVWPLELHAGIAGDQIVIPNLVFWSDIQRCAKMAFGLVRCRRSSVFQRMNQKISS